ncbi:MAG: response regulator transcription factor [Elusimicrobia bacterium]|nr:response regulator transcription factor [Elusimicrobiota bacterium]
MSARILVVDDEEDYRIIARDVLGANGFEVRLAEDGEEGLSALGSFRPELVLVDWMMPRMDGESFCRRLRADARFKTLPVLMLTVKQTAQEELEALHFGVDDFITKPFQPADLLARVRAALRRGGCAGAQ